MRKALFLGLTTYDIIYEVEKRPAANEKTVALEQVTSAGGPATNSAITFSLLGGESTLLSIIGKHPFAQLVRNELKEYSVHSVDLAPREPTIPFSSIIVEKGTGKRSVVSVNAAGTQIEKLPPDIFKNAPEILLVDGHQMALSLAGCIEAQKRGVITVLDGGSWKPRTESLLPYIDHAICSADFAAPKCKSTQETVAFLHDKGVPNIAITRGGKPIITSIFGKEDRVHVPRLSQVRSTLGAGDVFHGAFCYSILELNGDFSLALEKASQVATLSCEHLGARE